MLQVMSELTGELADCTICVGVVLEDGERIGAIADVDAFDLFEVDLEEAAIAVNRVNQELVCGVKLQVKGKLWEVRKLRKPMVDKTVTKSVAQPIGIAELTQRHALGLDLWDKTQLTQDELNYKGIEDEDFENSVEE